MLWMIPRVSSLPSAKSCFCSARESAPQKCLLISSPMSRTVAVPSKSHTTARSVTAGLLSGSVGQAQACWRSPAEDSRQGVRYTPGKMNLTDAELFQEAARRSAAREPFVLCTVTATARSAPRDAGAKMIVAQDGSIAGTVGGGPLEAIVIQEAIQILRDGGPSGERRYALTAVGDAAEPIPPGSPIPDDLGMKCGGEVTVFFDPVRPVARIVLYGAGHVGERVANLAGEIGLATAVIDDREKFVS